MQALRLDLALVEEAIEKPALVLGPREQHLPGRLQLSIDPLHQFVAIRDPSFRGSAQHGLEFSRDRTPVERGRGHLERAAVMPGRGDGADERHAESRARQQVRCDFEQTRRVKGIARGGSLEQRGELSGG